MEPDPEPHHQGKFEKLQGQLPPEVKAKW